MRTESCSVEVVAEMCQCMKKAGVGELKRTIRVRQLQRAEERRHSLAGNESERAGSESDFQSHLLRSLVTSIHLSLHKSKSRRKKKFT